MHHWDKTMGPPTLADLATEQNHSWVLGGGVAVGTRSEMRAYLKAIF